MYEVRLSEDAEKVFAKSDKILAKKLARCFRNLENSPRSHARKYLERSLEQEITLVTCVELVELEIEDGNFERAEHWLELALTLILPLLR